MDSLHKRLERSKQMQTVLRAFEARDRNLLEDNLWRVSFWSCASVLVMLCVALTQVGVALPPRFWFRSHQRNRFTGNDLFSCRSTLSGNCSMISGGSVLRCVILPKETWLQKKSGVNNHFIGPIFFHCWISEDHKPDVQPGEERSNLSNSAFNVNIEPQTNKEICSV